MYTYLKERQHYENLYDRLTVESARRGMSHYDNFYSEFESKLPKGEKVDKPGNAFLLNVFYMETVGNELLDRYEKRDGKIQEWIARDQAKDERISSARLIEEPLCHHCGKQELRIIDKSLMHRGETYEIDDPEEVLFMLHCPHCDNNSAFWEDGMAWKVKPTVCPKCQSEVMHKTTKTKKAITITYTCTSCKHSFKNKMDLTSKEEKPDPEFEKVDITFASKMRNFVNTYLKCAMTFKKWLDSVKSSKKKKTTNIFTML